MSDDPTKLPPQDDQPRDTGQIKGPSQWARKEEGTVADTSASDEGSANFLADDQMSLGSKLRGGGRDLTPEDEKTETRLCPACSTVNQFIDGKCTNCQFIIGSGGVEDVQEIRSAAIGTGEDPATKTILIIAVVVVVSIILVVGLSKIFGNKTTANETTGSGRPVNTTDTPRQVDETYAGTLKEVVIDDDFRARVTDAIESGNSGWENEGVDAFVYKYALSNRVISATSQIMVFEMFVGGEDAQSAAEAPGDIAFNLGFASLLDSLKSMPGVKASSRMEATGGSEPPDKGDQYIRYGYYYGLEHMRDLQPIIEALDLYFKTNGEYPHILKPGLTTKSIRTKQGYYFLANGIGYMPIFKTDSDGVITMGTGGGLSSLNPEQCQGYYLVMYGKTNKIGLDVHSEDNVNYYQRKIAPFPYNAKDDVKNVVLTPDGKLDGITCVVKNGILLDI